MRSVSWIRARKYPTSANDGKYKDTIIDLAEFQKLSARLEHRKPIQILNLHH